MAPGRGAAPGVVPGGRHPPVAPLSLRGEGEPRRREGVKVLRQFEIEVVPIRGWEPLVDGVCQ